MKNPQVMEKYKVDLHGIKYVQITEWHSCGMWRCILFYFDYKLKPQTWVIEESKLGEEYHEPVEETR